MASADKDGRIAQWLSDRHVILGMELHAAVERLDEMRLALEKKLDTGEGTE